MPPTGAQADLERKHIELVRAFGKDLREVADIFSRQRSKSAAGRYLERNGPPLYTNMPPCSGALYWVRQPPHRARRSAPPPKHGASRAARASGAALRGKGRRG